MSGEVEESQSAKHEIIKYYNKRKKNLANMLRVPSIKARNKSRMIMRNRFLQGAVKMVLGRHIVTPRENASVYRALCGSRGSSPIVGSCSVYPDQKRKTT